MLKLTALTLKDVAGSTKHMMSFTCDMVQQLKHSATSAFNVICT
jgi:hypothetical protein